MDIGGVFFDGWQGIVRTLIAACVAYAGLVLILRTSGKRTLSKLNAFDLVVTVALGSTLATILLSKSTALAEGLVALAMLALLQWIVARMSIVWAPFKKVIRSEPRLLLENGELILPALRDERVTRSEVEEAVRNTGFGALEQVAAVVLESDGSLSVISFDKAGCRSALRTVRGADGASDRNAV